MIVVSDMGHIPHLPQLCYGRVRKLYVHDILYNHDNYQFEISFDAKFKFRVVICIMLRNVQF